MNIENDAKVSSRSLMEAINKMKDDIDKAHRYINLTEELEARISELKKVSNRTKRKIKEYNINISEMNEVFGKLKELEEYNTVSNSSEVAYSLYSKADLMIKNCTKILTGDSLILHNQTIEIMVNDIKRIIDPFGNTEISTSKQLSRIYTDSSDKELSISEAQHEFGRTNSRNLKISNSNSCHMKTSISDIRKLCGQCKFSSKFTLTLRCNCIICVKCLKEYIKKRNPELIDNALEGDGRGEYTVCPCPEHKVPIEFSLLCKLFGSKTMQEASIKSMKRQIGLAMDSNKLFFFVCPGCKKLIRNPEQSCEKIFDSMRGRVCKPCAE